MTDGKSEAALPVPLWSCEFAEASGQGASRLSDLTVGAKFELKCHGDLAVDWAGGDERPVRVAFAKEDENYSLVVLKAESLAPREARLLVTSYKAGKHAPEWVRVLQGDKGFEFGKPQWEIKSVLKPGEQVQPYGPFGPWTLSLPLWLILLAVAVVTVLVYAVVRRVRRHHQRKRLLEELGRHRTALSPLHQFYRDSRTLRRRVDGAKDEDLKALGPIWNVSSACSFCANLKCPRWNGARARFWGI
ncbi:MAG: hypothetical protein HC902_06840 [Calothrix sp. SM1_5_4]|nr:hypothetical protein [Calothrix sp. SM1_5_4]